ncbi:hypothetical protein HMPREF1531_02175 [Propionibacterium sp. oral taxon 192 str. F0372]|uniref:phosphatidylinositol phosphate synthase n=1 Tax=Propionibacterium sp. oral taxon 192 TaxID=671222 RepID=UPI000353778C|nr:CDP-alcohol phosphatidyltransferase family protein [Propionibacterium sp. oral taxon 192]EPH02863.1 hypothetical protein HMPREF1531_02175 [Propionibacterium sp. oral taxon 192 str. F0372]
MLERIKSRWTKFIEPVALGLVKIGLSPNMVTWFGTAATCLVAIICFPQGWLWQGVVILLAFIFSDSLDGTMARATGQTTRWGAFLDSTLDRIADGAIFGGLTLYFYNTDSQLGAAVSLVALVFGQVTSYSKARGEAIGVQVNGGIAGRADRLVIVLAGALLTGLGINLALPIAMSLLCLTGAVTVAQRMAIVHRALGGQ